MTRQKQSVRKDRLYSCTSAKLRLDVLTMITGIGCRLLRYYFEQAFNKGTRCSDTIANYPFHLTAARLQIRTHLNGHGWAAASDR